MRLRQIVLGCWCITLLATSTAQRIGFPPSCYSFEEIARHMSVGGRRVECAPDLRQRLALIHLKPRPWQQARELLEKGLDVRFRPTGDAANRWILERDPAVVQRERRQRERLARSLDSQMAARQRLLRAYLNPKLPADRAASEFVRLHYAHLLPSVQEAQMARLRHEIEHARTMPLDAAMRNWRTYAQLDMQFSQYLQNRQQDRVHPKYLLDSFGFSTEELRWAQREARQWREKWASILSYVSLWTYDPQETQAHLLVYLGRFAQSWLNERTLEIIRSQLHPPISAREVIERGRIVRVQTFQLPPEIAAWILEDWNGDWIPLWYTKRVPMRLEICASWEPRRFGSGYNYNFSVYCHYRPMYLYSLRTPLHCSIHVAFTPSDAQSVFQRFDKALARAYQVAYACHQKLLENPVIQAPLPPEKLNLFDALTYWAKAYHHELIAEVFPELQMQPLQQVPADNTLAKLLNRCLEPYLIERHDTVWVLRHWGAFVRRVPDPPLAALWKLIRSRGDYTDWRAFYQATTSEQARWQRVSGIDWMPFGVGFPMYLSGREAVAYAWLVMKILENLPEVARAALWEGKLEDVNGSSFSFGLGQNRRGDVPLAALPASTRRELAQILQKWDLISELCAPANISPLPKGATLIERLWLVRDDQGVWQLVYRQSRFPERPYREMEDVFSLFQTPLPSALRYQPPSLWYHLRDGTEGF